MFAIDPEVLARAALVLLQRPDVRDALRSILAPAPARVDRTHVTPRGFAELHAVSTKTVQRWMRLGMPHHRAGKRLVRIPVAEASKWVEQGGANVVPARATRRQRREAA